MKMADFLPHLAIPIFEEAQVRLVSLWACTAGGLLLAAPSFAEEAQPPATCERAEINPVTGHTFCIKPLGAPVEAAPKAWLKSCDEASADKEKAKPGEPWTFRPNCADAGDQG